MIVTVSNKDSLKQLTKPQSPFSFCLNHKDGILSYWSFADFCELFQKLQVSLDNIVSIYVVLKGEVVPRKSCVNKTLTHQWLCCIEADAVPKHWTALFCGKHKVAVTVLVLLLFPIICVLVCWTDTPPFIRKICPLFIGHSCQGQTLGVESISGLWLWDCSLSLVQPDTGDWSILLPGYFDQHGLICLLRPPMFNRVHTCLLAQCIVILSILCIFSFAQQWHKSLITKKSWIRFSVNDQTISYFWLYATFSILCCDVQWKDGKKPWDDREGSVKTLQKAYSVRDEWHFNESNQQKRSWAQRMPLHSKLDVVGNVSMRVICPAIWNNAPYYPRWRTEIFSEQSNFKIIVT